MLRFAAVAVGVVLSAAPLYAQDNIFTINVASADIHAAPTTASPVIAKAPRGTTFAVTRELGSWVAIASPAAANGIGYLHVSWGTRSGGDDGAPPRAATSGTPTASSGTLQGVSQPADLAQGLIRDLM